MAEKKPARNAFSKADAGGDETKGKEQEQEKVEETAVPEKPKEEPKPAPEPQPRADPRQTDGQAPRAKKKSNTWLICCGCGCGCIVVVVILVVIFWMFDFFGAVGGTGGVSEIYNNWRAGTLYSATPSPK